VADIFTKEKRSWVMSRIRGRNTKIDLKMNELLKEIGTKYEMYPKMFGNPDFIMEEEKIAIFCDGDFWHGYRLPAWENGLSEFWKEKIRKNKDRDRKNFNKLREMGWSVIRLWQHQVERNLPGCVEQIISAVTNRRMTIRK